MTVRWLEDIGEDAERQVGQKAASVAAATDHGLDTPRGFVVTAETFESFIKENGLERRIERVLSGTSRGSADDVEQAAYRVQQLITDAEMAEETEDAIREAYENINLSEEVRNAGGNAVDLVGGQRETEFVAVRSSPTGTRIPGAHRTTLNVNGKDDVITAVKQCWASLYAAEALVVEDELGSIHSMAVIIQRMADADVSGTVCTTDPVHGRDGYLIEALYGYGSALSRGEATPDRYHVDRSGSVTDQDVVDKEWKLDRDPASGKQLKQRVPQQQRDSPCLDQEDIRRIVDAVKPLDGRYGRPIQIDFAIDRNQVAVLDVRTLQEPEHNPGQPETDPMLAGRAAAHGSASGDVHRLYSDTDVAEVPAGCVLAAVNASERIISALPDVEAVVAEKGGVTSNLSALARRLATPAVVATGNATNMLADGDTVTVDGGAGIVHDGTVTASTPQPQEPAEPRTATPDAVTATRIAVLDADTHPEADSAIIPTYTDRHSLEAVADHYAPEQVWANTDHSTAANVGRIAALDSGTNPDGIILQTFGEVMRLPTQIAGDTGLIAADAEALRENGDREAVYNAVQKLAEDTPGTCDTALLTRSVDRDLFAAAVEHGIDTVAVPADTVADAKQLLARIEQRYMLDRLRQL